LIINTKIYPHRAFVNIKNQTLGRRKEMKKKIISILLTFAMMLSFIPIISLPAHAAELIK
jgi:hypothetical protein